MGPEITRIESEEFSDPLEDIGTDEAGLNLVYEPRTTTERKPFGLKIHTDTANTSKTNDKHIYE